MPTRISASMRWSPLFPNIDTLRCPALKVYSNMCCMHLNAILTSTNSCDQATVCLADQQTRGVRQISVYFTEVIFYVSVAWYSLNRNKQIFLYKFFGVCTSNSKFELNLPSIFQDTINGKSFAGWKFCCYSTERQFVGKVSLLSRSINFAFYNEAHALILQHVNTNYDGHLHISS